MTSPIDLANGGGHVGLEVANGVLRYIGGGQLSTGLGGLFERVKVLRSYASATYGWRDYGRDGAVLSGRGSSFALRGTIGFVFLATRLHDGGHIYALVWLLV